MNWRSISFLPSLDGHVPQSAGLYAILRAERVQGLPVAWDIDYVGKSVNLRRRFREHAAPWRERSRAIRQGRVYREEGWEFWFKVVRAEDLDKGEQELIRRIKPRANVLLYGANT